MLGKSASNIFHMPDNTRYRLITFDVYTALFDIETSLTPIVHDKLHIADPLAFVRTWRRKQLELVLISNSINHGRTSFALITRRALDDTLTRSKLDIPDSVRSHLSQAWLTLQPWPEASLVLVSLKSRGHTLGLLSNGDADQLHTLARQLPPVFDHIFSSEQAGYYKPHPSVYSLPLQSLQLKPGEVLHVAGSATDALGTKAVGLHCAWSNRNHDPHLDPSQPVDYEMPDLNPLLSIL
jgi:2-haloacid dehalogenase